MNRYKLLFFITSSIAFLSIVGNIYLYEQKNKWENALYSQSSSSFFVEMILKESGADVSHDGIKKILENSKHSFLKKYKEINTGQFYLELGLDPKAIKFDDSEIFFQDGIFYGTKVFIPKHH